MSAIAVQTPDVRPQRPQSKRAQTRFLKRLREGMSVLSAAQHAGVNRRTLYKWRDRNPEFAAAWGRAYAQGTDALIDHAQKRAISGESDSLLMFLIKQRDPSFRENHHRVEITGDGGGPVVIEGRAVVGLADVNRLAAELGLGDLVGLDAGDPRRELAPAPDVLPGP